MTYASGESASSDIDRLNVTTSAFAPTEVAPTSWDRPLTPWNSRWTEGSGEPAGSVSAPVVVMRYRTSDWVGVVSSTTVRWPPMNAAELTGRLPVTLPAASSLSILYVDAANALSPTGPLKVRTMV